MAITGILRIFNGQIKRKPDPSNRRRMQSILIVEDEKRVADLLKTGLEENGYRVTVAYDGAMGLRLFRAQPFPAGRLGCRAAPHGRVRTLPGDPQDPCRRADSVLTALARPTTN